MLNTHEVSVKHVLLVGKKGKADLVRAEVPFFFSVTVVYLKTRCNEREHGKFAKAIIRKRLLLGFVCRRRQRRT